MTDDRSSRIPQKDEDRRAESLRQEDTQVSGAGATQRLDELKIPKPPGTRRQAQSRQSRPAQAVQGQPPRQLPPRSSRRGRARARRDSGLYLPLWSLILMLFAVMATAAGIVLLVIALGGNDAPQNSPIVIVSSPVPTTRPDSFPMSPATATLPPEADSLRNRPQVTFGLSGPTLPPVEISPTPQRITVGGQILVIDVGANQLNVRNTAGVIGTAIVFLADEGSIFNVVDGPQQADGLTWWKIQDPNNTANTGWAASNYLQPTTR
jgi:hypothetical protein